jgi:hypothetical protein
MIKLKTNWIEAEWSLDGIRSWGLLYSTNPYWRRERRARLHIKLYWLAMWVDVPWRHSEPISHGTAARMWGPSWWPALGAGPTFHWGWNFYKPWLRN